MASNFRQGGLSEELASKLLSGGEGTSMRVQKFPGRGKRAHKALGYHRKRPDVFAKRGRERRGRRQQGGGRHQIRQSLEGNDGGRSLSFTLHAVRHQ